MTAVDHHSLVAANLIHMGHGEECRTGAKRWSHGTRDVEQPLNTVTASGATAGFVASSLVKLRGTSQDGQPTEEPLHTISAQGTHFAEVRAFLIKYYSEGGQWQGCCGPLHTIPAEAERFGLVKVAGEDYAIADIGLRMLAPKELFKAQGFPGGYIIEWGINESGQRIKFSKSSQVRMVGNSVSPPIAQALVAANLPELAITKRRAA